MKNIVGIFLLAFSVSGVADETKVKQLYGAVYWPILHAVVACPKSRFPDPAKRAACESGLSKSGIRFVTEAQGNAEAMECARLHVGLAAGSYKIIDDAATDPWTSWRCLAPACNPGINEEVIAKSSVRSHVVDAEGKVYDHRMRYFIPPGYAKRLGKINPRFAVTLWNNRKGQIADVLK